MLAHAKVGDFRDKHVERLPAFVADDLAVLPRNGAAATVAAVLDNDMLDELKGGFGIARRLRAVCGAGRVVAPIAVAPATIPVMPITDLLGMLIG
jgi:hypothetical protein